MERLRTNFHRYQKPILFSIIGAPLLIVLGSIDMGYKLTAAVYRRIGSRRTSA